MLLPTRWSFLLNGVNDGFGAIKMNPLQVTDRMLELFKRVRQQTLTISENLLPEDSVAQPVIDVSPPKWHLAHTTWFFETFVLIPNGKDYKVFHPDFNFLFNSYYENIGQRVPRDKRGTITRPGLKEVIQYREYVDGHMVRLLGEKPPTDTLLTLVQLGLQHEQQHQELLLTDIKFILGNNPAFPMYKKDFYSIDDAYFNKNSAAGSLKIEEGVYSIGFEGKGFHFDNEKGKHKVYLHAFEIDHHLITNKEYAEFIEDGGYDNFNLWLADGWDWVKSHKISSPLYWHKMDEVWCIYDFDGLKKLPPEASVCHVNFYEAEAFARWKGKRLPSESEWEVAAPKLAIGKRWEWTNSAYLPYPYFTKEDGAIGEYNGKFMINQMVLRGGSLASPEGHVRITYRNFFPPDKQWQFSGIRLAKSI